MRSTRFSVAPRWTGAAALAALVAGLGAAGAFAHGSKAPIPACPAQTLVQPFLPWYDRGSYFLAPGGAFETTPAGWTLSSGVQTVPGNETSHVDGSSDASSLSLPAGSSATSPQICVTIHSPNIRLFALNPGSPRSTLQVSLNYTDQRGSQRTAGIAMLRGSAAWTLSPQIMFLKYVAAGRGRAGPDLGLVRLPAERRALADRRLLRRPAQEPVELNLPSRTWPRRARGAQAPGLRPETTRPGTADLRAPFRA